MKKFLTVSRLAAAATAAACFLAADALAFTVTRNVNSGKPPTDLLVVFDKTAKDAKSFKPTDRNGNAEFSFADDGALQIKIATREPSEILLPFPEPFDIRKANFILLTYKLEGQWRQAWQGNFGPWASHKERPRKTWWGIFTTDTAGIRSTEGTGFDTSSPDGHPPTEMKTVRLPATIFAKRPNEDSGADPAQTSALLFLIGGIRDFEEREYTITIDRIAVAE